MVDRASQGLDKDITFSVPSALQVLESQSGDCNEHTALFVSLAHGEEELEHTARAARETLAEIAAG